MKTNKILSLLGSSFLLAVSSFTSAMETGNLAPHCPLKTFHGDNPLDLSQYKGKVVYMDFWASWCAPCAQSMSFLSELQRQLKNQGLEVMAINLDVYHGAVRAPLAGRFDLGANWIEDTWGGASPVLSVPASTPLVLSGASTLTIAKNNQPITDKRPVQIMSSASPHETRRQQDFKAAYYFDDVSVKLAGGQSNEPDWNSDFYRAETRWDVNQKRTTLTLGLGFVTNDIRPTTRNIREHNSDRGSSWASPRSSTSSR